MLSGGRKANGSPDLSGVLGCQGDQNTTALSSVLLGIVYLCFYTGCHLAHFFHFQEVSFFKLP